MGMKHQKLFIFYIWMLELINITVNYILQCLNPTLNIKVITLIYWNLFISDVTDEEVPIYHFTQMDDSNQINK
jgi:hypothetical protein